MLRNLKLDVANFVLQQQQEWLSSDNTVFVKCCWAPFLVWGFNAHLLINECQTCLSKSRYIEAASSPKDVVILMDCSGSMTGVRIQIAQLTVTTIINTLSDDDFFNVIKVRLLQFNYNLLITCCSPVVHSTEKGYLLVKTYRHSCIMKYDVCSIKLPIFWYVTLPSRR